MRAVAAAGVLGASLGGMLWVVGVAPGRAALAAVCLVALLLARHYVGVDATGPGDAPWPASPAPGRRPGWHGAAQATRLLERAATDAADRRAVLLPRLRRLAEARLRRLPGARLSERSTAALTAARRPAAAAVDAALAELADLDPDDRLPRSAPRESR